MARFVPLSLIIDLDPEDRDEVFILSEDFRASASSEHSGLERALYHETLHLWQQATATFLLRCAEEDWTRMRIYERSGVVQRESPKAAEYIRVYPEVGYSAHDLQECLARFWELQSYDPLRVMVAESRSPRRAVDQTLSDRLRRLVSDERRRSELKEAVLTLAMEFAAGRYGRPFLSLAARIGEPLAAGLFPLAAFFALQTERPVLFYARLVDEAIPALGRQPVDRDLGNIWQAWYAVVRQLADALHRRTFGSGLGFGMDALEDTVLLEHAGYVYLRERMQAFVTMATQAQRLGQEMLRADPEFLENLFRQAERIGQRYHDTAQGAFAVLARQEGEIHEPRPWPELREDLLKQRQEIAGRALRDPMAPQLLTEFVAACPGSNSSKEALFPGAPTAVLSQYLVPPCVRTGQRIEPYAGDVPPSWPPHEAVNELAHHCLDVERRWLRFREVCRGF